MKLVPGALGRKIAQSNLLVQKNSPGLLLGAGIVGMVGSTVLACRATLKMEEVLWEAEKKLKTAKDLQHREYSEKDRQRDTTLIYFQTSVKVVRLYTPAIVVGGLSIAALTRSHNILNSRNAALTAAYTALEKGFAEYRTRVVAKYGEEEDRNLRYGTRTETLLDEETGKKKKVTRVAPGEPSVYARFFDQTSPSWNPEAEVNLIFLQCQQNYANDLLFSRGHVFLNEVYDMLGIPRSKAGSVVGWLLTPDGETDNHIDFGVFDGKTQQARDFVNGFEGAILLDFNVDGLIWDRFDMSKEGEPKWRLNK
jgi:Family of unknown function (DUF6353)